MTMDDAIHIGILHMQPTAVFVLRRMPLPVSGLFAAGGYWQDAQRRTGSATCLRPMVLCLAELPDVRRRCTAKRSRSRRRPWSLRQQLRWVVRRR